MAMITAVQMADRVDAGDEVVLFQDGVRMDVFGVTRKANGDIEFRADTYHDGTEVFDVHASMVNDPMFDTEMDD